MVAISKTLYVQQPCSNPSKSPETSGKVSCRKYTRLQLFCKLQKCAAKYRAAFARRRSGVRIPSAPLKKCQFAGKMQGIGRGQRVRPEPRTATDTISRFPRGAPRCSASAVTIGSIGVLRSEVTVSHSGLGGRRTLVRSSVVRGMVIMVANNLQVTARTAICNIFLDRHRHSNTFRKNSNRFRLEDATFTLL
jgi:hypothetical protein